MSPIGVVDEAQEALEKRVDRLEKRLRRLETRCKDNTVVNLTIDAIKDEIDSIVRENTLMRRPLGYIAERISDDILHLVRRIIQNHDLEHNS